MINGERSTLIGAILLISGSVLPACETTNVDEVDSFRNFPLPEVCFDDARPRECCRQTDNLYIGDDTQNVLHGSSGQDCIIGYDGNDTLLGNDGEDRYFGGAGNDAFILGPGNDIVVGLDGDDRVESAAGSNDLHMLFLGPGDDEVVGSDPSEWVFAGDGNDTVNTSLGDDRVTPGRGVDYVDVGPGDDTVFLNAECELDGNKTLIGGDGFDTLYTSVPTDELSSYGVNYVGFERVIYTDQLRGLAECGSCDCSIHGVCADSGSGESCSCEAGWAGEGCDQCTGQDCPSLSIEGTVVEISVAEIVERNGLLLSSGAPWMPGDDIYTLNKVQVQRVRTGAGVVEGEVIDIWTRGGTASKPDGRQVGKHYFGQPELELNTTYQADLDIMHDVSGGNAGYSIAHGVQGLMLVWPDALSEAVPPLAEHDAYANPCEPTPCDDPGFTGFGSKDESRDFANTHGRVPAPVKNTIHCGGSEMYHVDADWAINEELFDYWGADWGGNCDGGHLLDWTESALNYSGQWFNGCGGIHAPWARSTLIQTTSEQLGTYYYADCDDSEDNINCVHLGGLPYDVGAETTSHYGGVAGDDKLLFETDITINSSWSFSTYGDCAGVFKFENILMHELGHAAGLKHTTDACAIMYGNTWSSYVFNQKHLTCHDRARAAVLYPLSMCGNGYPCNCMLASGVQVEGEVCVP